MFIFSFIKKLFIGTPPKEVEACTIEESIEVPVEWETLLSLKINNKINKKIVSRFDNLTILNLTTEKQIKLLRRTNWEIQLLPPVKEIGVENFIIFMNAYINLNEELNTLKINLNRLTDIVAKNNIKNKHLLDQLDKTIEEIKTIINFFRKEV